VIGNVVALSKRLTAQAQPLAEEACHHG
jgi:hypothetical protein